MTDGKTEIVSFNVRLIFRDSRAIDFGAAADAVKEALADMMRINITAINLKKYGILLSGKGPVPEVLRIGETIYTLTNNGGLEIIVHIGGNEAFYMKDGYIHDLRDDAVDASMPDFDDADPDETELERVSL